MDLQQWRERGRTETLPSGLKVRYVEVSLLDLAIDGDIPAPLVGLVDQMISGDEVEVEIDDFARLAPMINGLIKRAVVDPPVADEPDDDHLGVEELPATDRLYLFRVLNEGAQALEPFREGDEQPLADTQSGDGLRDAPQPDNGPDAG